MLSYEDRVVVLQALDDIDRAPPPPDWGVYGPPLAIAGVLIGGMTSVFGSRVGLAGPVVVGALVAGITMLVVGVILAVMSGGFERARERAAAEAAIRQLESGDPDRTVRLRAATLLLTHTFSSHGEVAAPNYDPAEGARRIGEELPLVQAVEALLIEMDRGEALFTVAPHIDAPDSAIEGS